MNCLIIGNDNKSCKPLEKIMRQSGYFKLVSSCVSAAQAEDLFPKHKPDVIFIDAEVQTKDASGFLNYLSNNQPHVIAMSSVTEIGKISFDFTVTDFILKPFSNIQLRRVVNKIILTESNDRKSTNDNSFIFIRIDRAFLKIPTANIQYIQALADYVRIFTPEKVYTTYSTMKEMITKLPENDFSRVHRSYIVRIEAITQFKEGFLSIEQKLVPVGRLYKKDLMERLTIL